MNKSAAAEKQQQEVDDAERFAFGENWARFLRVIDDQRIQQAVDSLKRMLEVDGLVGKTFLDIGSGSGLFSLAARNMGAKVHSFDYDPRSVECTRELKRRYHEDDCDWTVEIGSVLDQEYLDRLGKFDIVYSWGVLHHTGDMWSALENVDGTVAPNGKLFIALYNDQGGASRRWCVVKKVYNRLPSFLRLPFAFLVYFPLEMRGFFIHLLRGAPGKYFHYILNYRNLSGRGMSWWHDKVDWIGGLPFEVSKPEEIFYFYKSRGYRLDILKTCGGGLGCNEFVFQRLG